MKKLLLLLSVIIVSASIFAASCSKTSSGSKRVVKEKNSAGAPVLPKNWPWRGVTIESRFTRPADIAYLASVNVNFVRLYLKPNKRSKREKATNLTNTFYAEINWADSVMDALKENNMTCLMSFDNLILDPSDEINDKSPEFWENKKYLDSANAMVGILAKHFQNRGDEFTCYEVIGEPTVVKFGLNEAPKDIEAFYKKTLGTIRQYDQKRYFLLTPGPWGHPTSYTNFDGYPSITDSKIIYGAHMYLPDNYTHQGIKNRPYGVTYPGMINGVQWDKDLIAKRMNQLKRFETKHHALVYIGEFQCVRWADGANAWVKDVADAVEANGWSWSMYAFQCDQDFWNPYYEVSNPTAPADKRILINKGKTAEEWQLLLSYFKRNAK